MRQQYKIEGDKIARERERDGGEGGNERGKKTTEVMAAANNRKKAKSSQIEKMNIRLFILWSISCNLILSSFVESFVPPGTLLAVQQHRSQPYSKFLQLSSRRDIIILSLRLVYPIFLGRQTANGQRFIARNSGQMKRQTESSTYIETDLFRSYAYLMRSL